MKTLLLNISDIHYGSQKPENEGVVLSAFITDVKEQICKFQYDDVFVLIGGDLVFTASKENYDGFDNAIVKKLMSVLSIDRSHFIIVPGNHDIKQSYIGEIQESFEPVFNSKYDENKFNDLIRKEAQKHLFFSKFDDFKKYMVETMEQPDYSLMSGCYNLNGTWSVYTLNSAILSCGGFNHIDDQGHLGVDTRGLFDGIQKDTHPKKILLLHHPETFCMDWVKHSLRGLYGKEFSLVLSGHTHDQDVLCHKLRNEGYIHCEAPQLFTDKYDDYLGYNFIELIDHEVARIVYREWVEKRNKFRSGSAFTEEESGIVTFESNSIKEESNPIPDLVEIEMLKRLKNEMQAFADQPYIWVERYLSDDRIDQIFKMQKSTLFTETDIINYAENIRIVAPSQYGLTCYGSHFLLTLWQTKHEFGIKVDADGVRTKKFEKLVERELETYQKGAADVQWIVIDNWRPYKKDQNGISSFIKQNFPNAHIVLMSPYHEVNFKEHLNKTESIAVAKTLYLTPLKHEQERIIVDEYNKTKFIDDSDAVLHKLDEDLKDFNLHRTPYSCITLLTVFKDSFDRNPVNRTSVLENILGITFDNTVLPTYKTSNPDIKDCEFCLGYFCTQLIDKEYYVFTRDFFYQTIHDFCELKKFAININQLFDVLCYNRIIIEENGYYLFHFTFWVYYFVASWMHVDEEYAKKMLSDKRYIHYPEVLEFYTGKDRKRKDAVLAVTKDLNEAVISVQKKAGIPDDANPFAVLRYHNDKSLNEKIVNEIETNVQRSNLPQAIKDQAADLSYNPSAAFDQEVFKVYSDFSVGYLVNLISISSKVLRNSDYLDAEIKQNLLEEITTALKVFSNIIYLVSPVFARQGYIQLPEYGFKLADSYTEMDEKQRTVEIIVTIPYNLTLLFKEDIFSAKLSPVYIAQFNEEKDKVKKHLLASLLVYKQPDGWDTALLNYLGNIAKDSYYLGTLLELMEGVLFTVELEDDDKRRMTYLVKSAIYKADKGIMPPSINILNQYTLPKPPKDSD